MDKSHKITIRRAIDEDSIEISNLIFNIWINENNFNIKKEDFPDLKAVDKFYNKNDGLFLVAISGNEIVGTVAYSKLSQNEFVLKRMFVNKVFRGHGIAQSLLDRLFDHLISKNLKNIVVYLSTKKATAFAAEKFYLKNGFMVIDSSKLSTNFPFFYQDDLFMQKSL